MSERQSRREILKKTAYVVPTLITLAAKPSFASSGSGRCETGGSQNGEQGNANQTGENQHGAKE